MTIKVGIISAIEKEIENFKNIISNYKKNIIGYCKIYIGTFKNIEIILIQSGIGKVSASIATMILIKKYKINFIINHGSAGSLSSLLQIGDIIIPTKTCYYDVDLMNFGYDFGQIPGYPVKFNNNKKLYNLLEKTAIQLQYTFFRGLLISGDSFIRNKNVIPKFNSYFSSAIAVDMESSSIAQVCYQFKIPLIIIKYISDFCNLNSTVQFKKNIYIQSLSSFYIIRNMLGNIIPT